MLFLLFVETVIEITLTVHKRIQQPGRNPLIPKSRVDFSLES